MIFQLSDRLQLSTLALSLLVGQAMVATTAFARTETARWSHSNPAEVVRFEVQIGDASGSYTEAVDLGKPVPDAQGVYTGSFTVADTRSVYIAVRAIGSSAVSVPSNEQLRPGIAPAGGGTTTGTGTALDNAGSSDPATSNALVRFDFSQGTSTGWQDTGANFSIFADDSLFNVSTAGGSLALTTQSASADIHSHYVNGSSSNYSNVTHRGRMAIDRAGAGIGITAYSLYPTYDRYYALRALPGEAFKLIAHPYAGLVCATDSTGVVPTAGKWYAFELAVESLADRNVLSARVWLRGSTRPSTAQVQCTDSASTRPTAGRVGVWSTGAGLKAWDDLEVVPISTSTGGGGTTTLQPPTLISIQPVTP